ncbi:hypothetical protein Tco_1325274, partial [Tanacetum coccineum]
NEMLRLQSLGSNTETGVPYTEEEIIAIIQKGKQRGHLPGVGRMLDQFQSSPEFGGASGSGGCGDDESGGDEDGDEDEEDEEDGDSATKSLRKVAGKVSLESFPLQFIPGAGLVSQMTSRPGRRGFVAGDSVMEENKTATLEESKKLFTVLQKLHDDLKLCNRRLENANRVFEGVNARAFNAYSSSNRDQKA